MQHDHDCILCYERTQVIGLLPCNHRPICYSCVMKMAEGGYYSCPICKATSKSMLFTDNLSEDYDVLMRSKNLLKGQAGSNHMFTSRTVKQHVQREALFICAFETCRTEYQSLNSLKKHLNEVHKRQFCELCLDNRKCLLSEQTLYSEPELNSHLADGEIEQTGVVSLYHPFCEFCRNRFYDEDTFLKHMKTHEQCFICSKQQAKKYVYYRDYKTLEQHFDASHYMCKHNNCLDKKFTNVFATLELRDFHYAEAHMGQNFSKKARRNIECTELTGFYQAEAQEIEEKPSDGFGKNFQKELVSISRKIELVNQVHEDGPIDIREFYPEKCTFTKHMGIPDIVNRYGSMAYMLSEGHSLTLQTVDFFRPMNMKNLPRNMLNSLIDDLYSHPIGKELKRVFFDGMAEIKSFEIYCFQVAQLVEAEHPLLFYYVFPQLIRFFKDTNERKKFMDSYYLLRLMQLPYGTESLLHSCRTYLEFITRLKTSIEECLCNRILQGKLDLGVYIKHLKGEGDVKDKNAFFISREKQKNLYHMVQKIKTCDLLKLNWLLKVGIPIETHTHLTKVIYLSPLEDTVNLLERICNSELAVVYSYFRIIEEALVNKERFKFEKTKEDVNLLRDLLQRNKDRFSKVKGLSEVTVIQPEIKKAEIKKIVAPKEVVYKISDIDLPTLPSPAKQQEEQTSGKSSRVEVGFINNGGVANLKKWDQEKRVEKHRNEEIEKAEARNKVLELRKLKKEAAKAEAAKAKQKAMIEDDNSDREPEPPVKMTRIVVNETPKPPEAKRPKTEAEMLQQAIQESKKSFEAERRRRKESQEERQERTRNELDKQRKESQAKREKQDKPTVSNQKQDDKKSKLKNVFQMLEYQEEELRMKKEAIHGKIDSPAKQPEKLTMKNLEKSNPIRPTMPVDDCDDYPDIGRTPEPQVANKQRAKNGKSQQIQESKPLIAADDFPSLGISQGNAGASTKKQQSWVNQVNGRPKSPQPQEVKVRKKKGRTTYEQTVDIFGRN